MRSLRAVWLVLSTAVRVSPVQSLICLCESASVVVDVLEPLFLAWIVTGALDRDLRGVVFAVTALVASVALERTLAMIGGNARFGQQERVAYTFETRIAETTARIPTLDHLESPRYLDQVQALRDQQGALGFALNTLLNGLVDLVRVGATLVLAASADWRLLLVAAAGVPSLVAVRWYARWSDSAERAAAQPARLTQHLLGLAHSPAAGAELRVFGRRAEIRSRLRFAVAAWRGPYTSRARRQAVPEICGSLLFFGVAGIVLAWLLRDVLAGSVGVGALVLAFLLVNHLRTASGELQGFAGRVTTVTRTAGRFLWLLDYEASTRPSGVASPPTALERGIRLESVSFAYPDAALPALQSVTLDLRPGSVVALVGENGAGKSTLVKLLAGLYQPTAGRILVDGTDLASLDVAAWRERLSGAFQDHATFELTTRQTIGIGDLPRLNDDAKILSAARAGAAEQVVDALPHGLDTQLGPAWPGGVGLSGGQWQRVALARGMLRQNPLLLVLDEPTAALDAATEHALFERYAASARTARRAGTVTLLVTHRFSTVAAADLVVVMREGRITEVGTHTELLAAGGHYAELYRLQARGYQ